MDYENNAKNSTNYKVKRYQQRIIWEIREPIPMTA